jgi:carbonic anhydrase/acetyltransferase-like protein (isoleucine patch superfamily)
MIRAGAGALDDVSYDSNQNNDRPQGKGRTMTGAGKAMIGGAVILGLLLFGGVLVKSSQTSGSRPAPRFGNHNIDPTADIHPSVILEGRVTVGAYTRIDAGTILTGNITIGHHTLIRCNVTIRGTNQIGNYTHIYDNVCIEGGRPAQVGGSAAQTPDRSIVGDGCWINHGATMHGTQIADGGAVGLNACCDYNTRIGKGAILADGSATHVDQIIPDNAFAEGVPAVVKKTDITDRDRLDYFGVLPSAWTRYEAANIEKAIRSRQ